MAFVRKVEWTPKERIKLHPSEVVCHVYADPSVPSIVQMDTLGSEKRKNPGKQSQTLQFSEDSARQLVVMLKRAFPGL